MQIQVDLNQLIERIHINPRTDAWSVQPIKTAIGHFGLEVDITQTDLLGAHYPRS